jgi:hypothetical protein
VSPREFAASLVGDLDEIHAREFRMLFPPDIRMSSRVAAWMTWGGRYDEYSRRWRVLTAMRSMFGVC